MSQIPRHAAAAADLLAVRALHVPKRYEEWGQSAQFTLLAHDRLVPPKCRPVVPLIACKILPTADPRGSVGGSARHLWFEAKCNTLPALQSARPFTAGCSVLRTSFRTMRTEANKRHRTFRSLHLVLRSQNWFSRLEKG